MQNYHSLVLLNSCIKKRDVQLTNFLEVSLTNYLFEGGKAELAKGLSPNFQISHSFNLGSSTMPPVYHFGAVYADASVPLLSK